MGRRGEGSGRGRKLKSEGDDLCCEEASTRKENIACFFFLTKGNKEVYFPGGGEGEGRDCRGMW